MKNKIAYLSGATICTLAIAISGILITHKQGNSIFRIEAAATNRTITCSNFKTFCTNKYLTTTNGNKIYFSISGANSNKTGLSVGGTISNSSSIYKITGIQFKYSPTTVSSGMTEMTVRFSTNTTFSGTVYVLDSNSKQTGNCGSQTNHYFKVTNKIKARDDEFASYYSDIEKTISSFTIYYSC